MHKANTHAGDKTPVTSRARRITAMDAELGSHLRQIRQNLGISQSYVAQKCGITYQQLQKYERGQNRLSVQRLIQIADILDIKISTLLDPHSDSIALFRPQSGPSRQIDQKAASLWSGIEDEQQKNTIVEIMEFMRQKKSGS